VRDAPGRPTRQTPARTPWLQEPWVRRARCTPRPSTRWKSSWRCHSDRRLRTGRGTASRRGGSDPCPQCWHARARLGGGSHGGSPSASEHDKRVESASAPAGVLAGTRRVCARDGGSLSVHHDPRKKRDPGWGEVAMGHPAGAARFRWARQAQDGHRSGTPQRWLDARRRVPSVQAAVSRPSDGSSMPDSIRTPTP
jgi:hypothetical protein